MKWYPLTILQAIVLLLLVLITDAFTLIQAMIVPAQYRPVLYLLFIVLILVIFFVLVNPHEPKILAATLAVILGLIAAFLILVQDVILANNLSWRTVVVLLGAIAGPFASGWIYERIQGS
jgi:hypothetical protein